MYLDYLGREEKGNSKNELTARIKRLECKFEVWKEKTESVEDFRDKEALILTEIMKLLGLKRTCYINEEDREELRKTHELLLDNEYFQLWSKRKK